MQLLILTQKLPKRFCFINSCVIKFLIYLVDSAIFTSVFLNLQILQLQIHITQCSHLTILSISHLFLCLTSPFPPAPLRRDDLASLLDEFGDEGLGGGEIVISVEDVLLVSVGDDS